MRECLKTQNTLAMRPTKLHPMVSKGNKSVSYLSFPPLMACGTHTHTHPFYMSKVAKFLFQIQVCGLELPFTMDQGGGGRFARGIFSGFSSLFFPFGYRLPTQKNERKKGFRTCNHETIDCREQLKVSNAEIFPFYINSFKIFNTYYKYIHSVAD